MDYLIMEKPQLGTFYLLPKVRKRRSNVPGHPINSNNDAATENVSSFLDFYLKTIIPTIPHTTDFLSRLNQLPDIPDNTLLVRLHPHIRHDGGLETMWRYLDKREDQSVSSDSLYRLTKNILKHNYFELGQDTPSNQFIPRYTIKSWTLAQNAHRIMQALLWLDWKSLATQSFNDCYGYVIWVIFFVCGLIPLRNQKIFLNLLMLFTLP